MENIIKIGNQRIKRERKPDRFSITLVRSSKTKHQGLSHSTTCFRLIAPELCLLTLLPNKHLIHAIREIARYLDFGTENTQPLADKQKNEETIGPLKESGSREWMSQLLRTADQLGELKEAKQRASKRSEILGGEEGKHSQQNASQHLSLRAYPVRNLFPQKQGTTNNYVLVVAFHLTEGWFSGFVRHMKGDFQQYEIYDLSTIHPHMLDKGIWKKLHQQLMQALGQASSGTDPQNIILHVPEASKLKGILAGGPWIVKDDMPREYTGDDRLVIRRHTARTPLITRMQLPPLKEKSAFTDIPSSLPNLTELSPRKKDQLIRMLWGELEKLREKQ